MTKARWRSLVLVPIAIVTLLAPAATQVTPAAAAGVTTASASSAAANGNCIVRAWLEQGITSVRVRQQPTTNSATIGWLDGWEWASASCAVPIHGGWYSCGGRTSDLWVTGVGQGNWFVARMCAWWG
jgi:hypothetical protein